jgi:quinohemoprotein ethanol dehydrogenase
MQVKLTSSATALAVAALGAWLFFAFDSPRVFTALAAPEQGQIDQKRLMAADRHPGEWLTTGRDFGKGHYSPLDQINTNNVVRLGFAWTYDTQTTRGLEATPIVVDGVMYTSGSTGKAYALDAKTGKEIWSFDPHADLRVNREACCDEVNRGVAVWKGKVYVASFDGILYALDAATGKTLWRADTITDKKIGYSVSGAPEVAGHVVVIGNAGSEYDARGYVSAYDLNTGKFAWRFYTVPGDPAKPQESAELEEAVKTWDPKSRWDMGGGGTVWDSLVYDPELNLLYFGTGNGTFFDRSRRSPSGGDNLYIASILALNPDTGRMVWHYQEVPGDQWDYDTLQPIILADLRIGGASRRVLMQASKDGFFYILDRRTGEVLSAEKFVPVTWAERVDLKTGRPIETAGARDYKNEFNGKNYLHPASMGGHNWNPMAYDPRTGLVYIPEIENGETGIFSGKTFLRAWDPIQSKTVWEQPSGEWWDHAGVLATAGGLVFQGNCPGHFMAYDAASGVKLKDIDTGSTIIAAPMSYEIGGVQYIAVMAAWGGGGWSYVHPENAAYQRGNEGRILVFKLDGGATPVPALLPPIQPIPQPPPETASADTVKQGGALFAQRCAVCHVNQPRSEAPDLRRMAPETHDSFGQIVLGGILKNAGMPPWEGILTQADVDAIHAYLTSISWEAYNKQQAATKN